jgi:hypothetical protein
VFLNQIYIWENVGTRTRFSIEIINGRTIRSHSHFTTEDEILLLPGTYKVNLFIIVIIDFIAFI